MRRVIVREFITLDGVIQSPGGPEDDISAVFAYGGWVVSYSDDVLEAAIEMSVGHNQARCQRSRARVTAYVA